MPQMTHKKLLVLSPVVLIPVSCVIGRDSVVVNSPESQSGGTGFDSLVERYMPETHPACYPFRISKLVPVWAGVK